MEAKKLIEELFKPDNETFSDLLGITTPVQNLTANISDHQPNTGFRIIMDYNKTSILVSGKDGYIYLIESNEQYDTSSPWGSIDLKSPGVDVDVFGRIMSYKASEMLTIPLKTRKSGKSVTITSQSLGAADVRVSDPGHMPNTDKAS